MVVHLLILCWGVDSIFCCVGWNISEFFPSKVSHSSRQYIPCYKYEVCKTFFYTFCFQCFIYFSFYFIHNSCQISTNSLNQNYNSRIKNKNSKNCFFCDTSWTNWNLWFDESSNVYFHVSNHLIKTSLHVLNHRSYLGSLFSCLIVVWCGGVITESVIIMKTCNFWKIHIKCSWLLEFFFR